jgi:hypothetical protein
MNTAVGVALTGAQLFNGLSGEFTDAVEFEKCTLDQCLTHPTPYGEYHYHSWSPCINRSSKTTTPGKCKDDESCMKNPVEYGRNLGWTDTSNWGGIVGVAKDGHIIYGPYNENGELWSCDDHDICNGRFFKDGSYGYVSTTTHPYLVGCWGPGP